MASEGIRPGGKRRQPCQSALAAAQRVASIPRMESVGDAGAHPLGLKICRHMLHPLFAISAAGCLLALVGWTGVVTDWQHWATTLTGLAFAAERWWVFRILQPRGKERRRLLAHLVVAGIAGGIAATLLLAPHGGDQEWSAGGHLLVQCAVLLSGVASFLHHQGRFTSRAVHPGMLLIGSFLAIVVAGTLLLKMPRCVPPGGECPWLVAAFTSTSAVCVTGLVVENTAEFFSPTGQMVILFLIQVGGLGIMTITFFAALMLAEGISLHDRLLLGRMIQEERLSRIGVTLSFIVGTTFVSEGIGAAVLYAGMDAGVPEGERLFQAVFHSVSAFCNAGFSTFPDGLATAGVANGTWQVCVMTLIVLGGLGVFVIEDLAQWVKSKAFRPRGGEWRRHRVRVHTRLVLASTGILLVAGAAVIFVSEFLLGDGPANHGRTLTSFFHSVTARTAGFNTVPMAGLAPLTMYVLMILMFIGGSPGGTAGGLRTTVVAVALGHLWSQVRGGRRGMVAFHRTIPQETGAQALGLIVMAGIWLTVNFIILHALESGGGIPGERLLFELVSAFATVGLSIDVTSALGDAGRSLLIVNMFVGRIGLITFISTLVPPDTRPASGRPKENILLT